MSHYCPHANRHCTPTAKCGPCSGGMIRDGEQVITRMMFRDSVQHAVAANVTDSIRAQARADHEAWKRGQSQANEGPRGFDDSARLAKHFADKAQEGARMIAEAADNAARVQAHADHYTAEAARRDHALMRNGYDKSF